MVNKIKESIKEIVERSNGTLYDLEYVTESSDNVLRVLVDKTGGIDLDTLVELNQNIGEFLDTNDLIDSEYLLEVASPGAERPIRDEQELIDSIDKYIYIKTFEQEYFGTLKDYKDGNLVLLMNLKGRMKEISVPYIDVDKARIAVKI